MLVGDSISCIEPTRPRNLDVETLPFESCTCGLKSRSSDIAFFEIRALAAVMMNLPIASTAVRAGPAQRKLW